MVKKSTEMEASSLGNNIISRLVPVDFEIYMTTILIWMYKHLMGRS